MLIREYRSITRFIILPHIGKIIIIERQTNNNA
jgi:hypothetical protein